MLIVATSISGGFLTLSGSDKERASIPPAISDASLRSGPSISELADSLLSMGNNIDWRIKDEKREQISGLSLAAQRSLIRELIELSRQDTNRARDFLVMMQWLSIGNDVFATGEHRPLHERYVELLGADSPDDRAPALDLLGSADINDTDLASRAAKEMLRLTQDKDKNVRGSALVALANFEVHIPQEMRKEARDALLVAAQDSDVEIRARAAWSIGSSFIAIFVGDDTRIGVEALLKLTNDAHHSVRTKAMIGWERYGGTSAASRIPDELVARVHRAIIRVGESDPLVDTTWVAQAVERLDIRPTPKLARILAEYKKKEAERERRMNEYRARGDDFLKTKAVDIDAGLPPISIQ